MSILSELQRLRELVATWDAAEDPDTILALPVPDTERYYLGLTFDRALCALVRTSDRGRGADIRLRNIEVREGVRCRVRAAAGAAQQIDGSLVICRTEQDSLVELFLRLYADAIDKLGPAPNAEAVSSWLQGLAILLSKLESEGRRSIRGLWAELLVIREFGDPSAFVRRWHADPRETFDFLAPGFALEVKSCQDAERVHEFSLAQLQPPSDVEAWVASVIVRADPRGTSALELLESIEAAVADPEIRSSLRSMAIAIGGQALIDDRDHRFDAQMASSTLRLLPAIAVPSVRGDVDEGVLQVSVRTRCRDVADAGSFADAVARLRPG